MREFILLNQGNEIVERASVKENLTRLGEAGLNLIEFEGDFLIGDRIENGTIVKVSNPNTERGRMEIGKTILEALRNKLKAPPFNLTDQEINRIIK